MISIYSQNGEVEYRVTEYTLDTPDDLEQLKIIGKTAAPGSSAFIIATSEVYMLNNQREWVKI
jgi:hypothetical protein